MNYTIKYKVPRPSHTLKATNWRAVMLATEAAKILWDLKDITNPFYVTAWNDPKAHTNIKCQVEVCVELKGFFHRLFFNFRLRDADHTLLPTGMMDVAGENTTTFEAIEGVQMYWENGTYHINDDCMPKVEEIRKQLAIT